MINVLRKIHVGLYTVKPYSVTQGHLAII